MPARHETLTNLISLQYKSTAYAGFNSFPISSNTFGSGCTPNSFIRDVARSGYVGENIECGP